MDKKSSFLSRTVVFFLFAFAFAVIFFSHPVFAGPLTINNLPGGGYRIDGYGTANTASNPQGSSASSSGGGAAGLNMGANYPVVVAPPSGAAMSLAAAGAAAGVFASTQLSSGQYTPIITNPAAALTAASQLMMTAGWMAAGTPAGIPLMAAAAVVGAVPSVCAAVSGCQWLNSMAANGITVNSSGAAQKAGVLTPAHYSSYYAQGFTGSMDEICAYIASRYTPPYNSVPVFYTCDSSAQNCSIYRQGQDCGGACWMASSSSGSTFIAAATGPSSVPSNAEIVSAINASTSANNQAAATAAQNASAADMINLAIMGQLAMNGLNETAALSNIASLFTQQSESIDSLGNVVQQVSRNVTSITPGVNAASPPVLQNIVQSATVTNGSVTSSTSTTGAPTSAPAPGAAVAAAAAASAASDLCVQHPEILACADITKLNDLAPVSMPNITKTLTALVPVSLGGPALCPPPLILPGMMGAPPTSLDLARPICNFASAIKAINLLIASLSCFWIISAGFKNNG